MADPAPAPDAPQGAVSLRVMPVPADCNSMGKIFGGWVLSQMDTAGELYTSSLTGMRMVTIAVDSMKFNKPVEIGDEVTCYVRTGKIGRTSLAVLIETWVRKQYTKDPPFNVTIGTFVYVAIDDNGHPTPHNLPGSPA